MLRECNAEYHVIQQNCAGLSYRLGRSRLAPPSRTEGRPKRDLHSSRNIFRARVGRDSMERRTNGPAFLTMQGDAKCARGKRYSGQPLRKRLILASPDFVMAIASPSAGRVAFAEEQLERAAGSACASSEPRCANCQHLECISDRRAIVHA